MEKKNNILIWILLIIIAILVVLCVLFATNKITFNSSNNDTKNTLNDTKDNNSTNADNKLNNNEAEAIVKSLFTSTTVRNVIDNPQLPNCKTGTKVYSEKELGLSYEGNGFYKAENFNTYEEYINDIKSYFTDEYFTNNIENKNTIATKTKTINGEVWYNFYEKDGALYCINTGKGSDAAKGNFKEINYNITNISSNEIKAIINASWYDISNNDGAEEKINITIIKENDIWKIKSYEVV